MRQLPIIFKREFTSFFATPLAYVFLLIFLVLSSVFTFYLAGRLISIRFLTFIPGCICFLYLHWRCVCGQKNVKAAPLNC